MAERPAVTRDDAIGLVTKLRGLAETLTEGERTLLVGVLGIAAAVSQSEVEGFRANIFGEQTGANPGLTRPGAGGDFGPLGGSVKTGTSLFEAADKALGGVDEAVGDAISYVGTAVYTAVDPILPFG